MNYIRSSIILFTAFFFFLPACRSSKPNGPEVPAGSVVQLDSITMEKILEAIRQNASKGNYESQPNYRETAPRSWDLVHMYLSVAFDYAKMEMKGNEFVSMKPVAYPQDLVVLDAKSMQIDSIERIDSVGRRGQYLTTQLRSSYEKDLLTVYFPKTIAPGERITLHIKYVAKPNTIPNKGSAAITDNKGLYFINNFGIESDKPRQIWTQGETESNSAWFVTIDKPNQKMTQELQILVQDSQDVSLSNGLLVKQIRNKDGSHTDIWKQSLPAAPYLTMMAIGNFAVEKDHYKNKEVNYYVEPKYKPYAKLIFGKTPEMIAFFSGLLKVDYPWEKYSQVVVRDYVSGAMENTSATLHGEALQHDARAHLDNDYEDYICHELFHQWFGDLVTCESWGNLTLNESFATYGEFLWFEHSRGRAEADYHREENLETYLSEASYKRLPIVRYNYDDKEDMFDAHSYQKGALVLHMLRCTLGDSVFFRGLKIYLDENRFQSAEIHQLRLAMEKASGLDLNWFFNQWYLRKGHPKYEFTYTYNEDNQSLSIHSRALSLDESAPVIYRVPAEVDIYVKGIPVRKKILIDSLENTFTFDIAEKPYLILMDPERTLLWETEETKAPDEWKYQAMKAKSYAYQKEAVIKLLSLVETRETELGTADYADLINYFLAQPFWGSRELGLGVLDAAPQEIKLLYYDRMVDQALHESKPLLRIRALTILTALKKEKDIVPVLRAACNDSSYQVLSEALYMLNTIDNTLALKICSANEGIDNGTVRRAIGHIYSADTTHDHADFLVQNIAVSKGYERNSNLMDLEEYIKGADPVVAVKCLQQMKAVRKKGKDDIFGMFYSDLRFYYENEAQKAEALLSKINDNPSLQYELTRKLDFARKILLLCGD